MSNRQSPRAHPMSFGYYYGDPDKDNPSHQPSGPPLLDHDEHDMLQNFFENPNNIDPNFLNTPHQYHPNDGPVQPSSGHTPIHGDHTSNWLYNGHNYQASTAVMMPSQPMPVQDHHRGSYGSISQYPATEPQPGPTEDVHAAARLLYGNHRQQQGHVPHRASEGDLNEQLFAQQSRPYERSQYEELPYQHAQPQQHQQTPYHTTPYPQGRTPGRNGTYEQPPQMGRMEGPTDQQGNPPQGQRSRLKFGTDEKFKSTFTGGMPEAPDEKLTNALAHNMDWLRKVAVVHGASPGKGSRNEFERKRSRAGESEDEAEYSSDGGRSHKRRKSKIRQEDDDDDEDDEDDDGGESGSGRRKSRSGGSPGKRRKWSPSASKQPRENLTEEQKRNNHIQSEQKRRNLIKQGFEDLTRMVPELRAGGYSKSNMLVEAAKFIRVLQDTNGELKERLRGMDNG